MKIINLTNSFRDKDIEERLKDIYLSTDINIFEA